MPLLSGAELQTSECNAVIGYCCAPRKHPPESTTFTKSHNLSHNTKSRQLQSENSIHSCSPMQTDATMPLFCVSSLPCAPHDPSAFHNYSVRVPACALLPRCCWPITAALRQDHPEGPSASPRPVSVFKYVGSAGSVWVHSCAYTLKFRKFSNLLACGLVPMSFIFIFYILQAGLS